VGIKKPEGVAVPSVRNDAAFLYTTVGVTSVVAVAGGFLPGDWVRTLSARPTASCRLARLGSVPTVHSTVDHISGFKDSAACRGAPLAHRRLTRLDQILAAATQWGGHQSW